MQRGTLLALMASPEKHVAEQLNGIPGYLPAFAAAFPGEPDPVTLANVRKAMAVFEATLLMPNAPFGLVAFLATLTGEQPSIELPILPPSVATMPRPQP
jgi:cytochrome c peroxidase